MKLDSTDIKILLALHEDARASLRKIATATRLTTPTVSYHISKLLRLGLIERFVPLFNMEKLQFGIIAFITVTQPHNQHANLLRKLKNMEEIAGIYFTVNGQILLKLNVKSMQEIDSFLSNKIARNGFRVVDIKMISKIVKDEQPINLRGSLTVEARCDFCKGPINTERPYTIKVSGTRYLFCCRNCRNSYIERNRRRLEMLGFVTKRPLHL